MIGAARRGIARFSGETRGSAAVEFVLWLGLLIVPILSVVDVGAYVFQKMQLQIASQAAVQFIWHTCDPNLGGVPAFQKCSALTFADITTSAQSTTLGSDITVTEVKEGGACTKTNSTLTWVGTPSSATPAAQTWSAPTIPATCTGTGSTTPPGDYVSATVSYPYKPIFKGLSVGSLLTTPITHTAILRLN
jgi:Flp pilus assembly protein TadG